MNKYKLNESANRYVAEVIPHILHYKRLSINGNDLFINSGNKIDIPNSEILDIMGWLKENYIKKENKNESFGI